MSFLIQLSSLVNMRPLPDLLPWLDLLPSSSVLKSRFNLHLRLQLRLQLLLPWLDLLPSSSVLKSRFNLHLRLQLRLQLRLKLLLPWLDLLPSSFALKSKKSKRPSSTLSSQLCQITTTPLMKTSTQRPSQVPLVEELEVEPVDVAVELLEPPVGEREEVEPVVLQLNVTVGTVELVVLRPSLLLTSSGQGFIVFTGASATIWIPVETCSNDELMISTFLHLK
jgi:hypothetical protein